MRLALSLLHAHRGTQGVSSVAHGQCEMACRVFMHQQKTQAAYCSDDAHLRSLTNDSTRHALNLRHAILEHAMEPGEGKGDHLRVWHTGYLSYIPEDTKMESKIFAISGFQGA